MSEGARAACVIGWPIKHSRSPLIHNYWIEHHGLAAAYRRVGRGQEAAALELGHPVDSSANEVSARRS